MKVSFENKVIELFEDQAFVPLSSDNSSNYDYEYLADENNYSYVSKIGIRIWGENEKVILSSAIICEVGGATTVHDSSFLIENNVILICVCNKVYSLDLESLKLNWKLQVDDVTCFSIIKWDNHFVTHGEIQLSYFNGDGGIIWTFSARDIFVTLESEDDFRLENGIAIVRDFSKVEYHLNSKGKVIKEIDFKK
ncbi:MAG: hypothetical protein CMO01_19125 [Thalassobius sp.]|nr:hypothetical protein [Thalassovita sp.]